MKGNSLYNKEDKLEFLNGTNDLSNGMNWFEKVAKYEQKLKKDLSLFSVAEIMGFYMSYCDTTSEQYLRHIHNFYLKYADWMGVENNKYKDVSFDMLLLCLNRNQQKSEFVRRDELLEIVKDFKNDCEKVLVLGLFEGMDMTDLSFLTIEDVDFERCIVKRQSRSDLLISKKLCEYILKSASMERLEPYNKVKDEDRYTILEKDDKLVIKRLEYYKSSGGDQRLIKMLKKLRDYYNYGWLKAIPLRNSGIICLILRYYEEQKGKTFKEVANEHVDEIRDRYLDGWRFDKYFEKKYGYLFD